MPEFSCICIIDDDPIFVFGMKKLLEMQDIAEMFLIYENGRVAIEQLKKRFQNQEIMPELIFLDINMPVFDGWSFLSESANLEVIKNIRIYMVTSSIDPADIERVQKYTQVKTCLIKPVRKAELVSLFKQK